MFNCHLLLSICVQLLNRFAFWHSTSTVLSVCLIILYRRTVTKRTFGQTGLVIHTWYASHSLIKTIWVMAISQHQFYLDSECLSVLSSLFTFFTSPANWHLVRNSLFTLMLDPYRVLTSCQVNRRGDPPTDQSLSVCVWEVTQGEGINAGGAHDCVCFCSHLVSLSSHFTILGS